MNPHLNDLWSPEDRTRIFSALLTPERNTWRAGSHVAGPAWFELDLDATGLVDVEHQIDPVAYGFFYGSATGIHHVLTEDSPPGPECGPPNPTGCGLRGTYTVTAADEPSPLMSMIVVGMGLLIGRAKFA
jgi:hypothetical protein